MSSRYYATVYDIVKPIATFLHPIRVEGVFHIERQRLTRCPSEVTIAVRNAKKEKPVWICREGQQANGCRPSAI